MRRSLLVLCLLAVLLTSTTAFAEGVIIKCQRPCEAAKAAAVAAAGGNVTYAYEYVNAIAADIPSGKSLRLPAGTVRKDVVYELPAAIEGHDGLHGAADTEVDAAAAVVHDDASLSAAIEADPQGSATPASRATV